MSVALVNQHPLRIWRSYIVISGLSTLSHKLHDLTNYTIRLSDREGRHSLQPRAKLKHKWSCNSTLPYAFMPCHHHHHHHHWLDSPWCALSFLRSFAHSSLSRATFFQFLTSNILISWSIPSSHRNFGFPALLTPSGLVWNIWALAFLRSSAHSSLSRATFFQFLTSKYSHVLIHTIFPPQFRSSNSSHSILFGVKYIFMPCTGTTLHLLSVA